MIRHIEALLHAVIFYVYMCNIKVLPVQHLQTLNSGIRERCAVPVTDSACWIVDSQRDNLHLQRSSMALQGVAGLHETQYPEAIEQHRSCL